MMTPTTQTTHGIPGTSRPKPVRIVRGPDGRTRVVRRGLAALAALQAGIPKVLRIGVVQGSRIVEERLMRRRETISIGASERNHFAIPTAGIPARHPLFELRTLDDGESRYFLTFLDGMTGRVAFPPDRGGVVDFEALRTSGRAVRTSKGWQVPLDERCRGKVVVGDTTLLFQFVVPPPVQPRPQLPASVRGGWISRLEIPMVICLGISAVLHAAMMTAAVVPNWPKPTLDEILASEWAQMPLPQVEGIIVDDEEAPLEDAASPTDESGGREPTGATDDAAGPETTAGVEIEGPKPDPGRRPTGDRESGDAVVVDGRRIDRGRYEAMQASVRNSLALENILGGDRGGLGVAEAFGGRSGSVGNLGDTLAHTLGTEDGRSGGSEYTTIAGTLREGPAVGDVGGHPADGGVTVRVPEREVEVEPEEIKVEGRVDRRPPEDAGSTGMMSAAAFRRVFNRKVAGIERCYNNVLPRDPTLQGDLTFLITINMQGGVAVSVESDSSALRAAGVSACIERQLSSMNFASTPPQGGSFRVRQSFSFFPP